MALRHLASAPRASTRSAMIAMWKAATGADEIAPTQTNPCEALRRYRLIHHEVRVEMRVTIGRLIVREAGPSVRSLMLDVLRRFEDLEAFAVAPPLARRRPAAVSPALIQGNA